MNELDDPMEKMVGQGIEFMGWPLGLPKTHPRWVRVVAVLFFPIWLLTFGWLGVLFADAIIVIRFFRNI